MSRKVQSLKFSFVSTFFVVDGSNLVKRGYHLGMNKYLPLTDSGTPRKQSIAMIEANKGRIIKPLRNKTAKQKKTGAVSHKVVSVHGSKYPYSRLYACLNSKRDLLSNEFITVEKGQAINSSNYIFSKSTFRNKKKPVKKGFFSKLVS